LRLIHDVFSSRYSTLVGFFSSGSHLSVVGARCFNI